MPMDADNELDLHTRPPVDDDDAWALDPAVTESPTEELPVPLALVEVWDSSDPEDLG